MVHTENKEDLAKFISREVLINAPEDQIIVVAGDFSDPTEVEASISEIVSEPLEAVHEEANTRIIVLHRGKGGIIGHQKIFFDLHLFQKHTP